MPRRLCPSCKHLLPPCYGGDLPWDTTTSANRRTTPRVRGDSPGGSRHHPPATSTPCAGGDSPFVFYGHNAPCLSGIRLSCRETRNQTVCPLLVGDSPEDPIAGIRRRHGRPTHYPSGSGDLSRPATGDSPAVPRLGGFAHADRRAPDTLRTRGFAALAHSRGCYITTHPASAGIRRNAPSTRATWTPLPGSGDSPDRPDTKRLEEP